MIKLSRVLLLLCLTVFLFSACSSEKKESLESILSRKWKYTKVVDESGKSVKQIADNDYLLIAQKNGSTTFHYELHKEGLKASGSWAVSDSNLLLTYDLKPVVRGLDSSFYRVENGEPSVVLLSEGKKVTTLTESGIVSEKNTRSFNIVSISPTTLVFQENGLFFHLEYTPPPLEGAISLNSIGRGIIGLISLILILYAFSSNRKIIPWKLVATGLFLQILFALGVLKVDFIKNIFEAMGNVFVVILGFTMEGSRFVFGDMVNPGGSIGFVFAFQILPTIIFFSALTSLLFYMGILQKIVYGLAWVMSKTMKLSGAESLAAAANIFLGQTEAPLMVKPYISNMTRSELMCLMTGGMATIAGGVMAAYIGFLGGDDPEMRLFFAKHLLAASIMSAPAAVVAAKILMPQDQKFDEKLVVSKERIGKNVLEAISNGTTDGLKLAVNVGAMLLVFIAMIAMVNFILQDGIGSFTGLNEKIAAATGGKYNGLTMQFLLGYICAPLSWLMGVCTEDMVLVGQLLGEKTILNEFVAYATLGNMQTSGAFAEQKSIIIATYILCGFANFASIGIQIGGIGSLAPEKRTALSELGFRALLGGTVASLLTAVVVGMLM
ncbi:MAG: Na+ dependent nucleoside transporter [Bacteroidetes bacterium]|nr:Na+ dependent nucleoside transporter [Bacteroidota bacterium]